MDSGNRFGRTIWTVWGYLSGAVARYLRPEVTDQGNQSVNDSSDEAAVNTTDSKVKAERSDKNTEIKSSSLGVREQVASVNNDDNNEELLVATTKKQSCHFVSWSAGTDHTSSASDSDPKEETGSIKFKKRDTAHGLEKALQIQQKDVNDKDEEERRKEDILVKSELQEEDVEQEKQVYMVHQEETEHLIDEKESKNVHQKDQEMIGNDEEVPLELEYCTDDLANPETLNVLETYSDEISENGDQLESVVQDKESEIAYKIIRTGQIGNEVECFDEKFGMKKEDPGYTGVIVQSEIYGQAVEQDSEKDHREGVGGLKHLTETNIVDEDDQEKVPESQSQDLLPQMDDLSKHEMLNVLETYSDEIAESSKNEIEMPLVSENTAQSESTEALRRVSTEILKKKEEKELKMATGLGECFETIQTSVDTPWPDSKQDTPENTPETGSGSPVVAMKHAATVSDLIVCEFPGELRKEPEAVSTPGHSKESKANLHELQAFAERGTVVACSGETLKTPEEAVETEQGIETLIESLDQTHQELDETKFLLTEDVESSTKLRSEHERAEPFQTESQPSIITLEATELLEFTGGELSQDALDSLTELQGNSTLGHFEESKANLYDLQTFAERHLEGEVVVAHSVENSETLKAPEEAVEIEQDIETVIESLGESESQTHQRTDETKFSLTEDVESSTKLRSEHEKAEPFETESQSSIITLEATELLEFTGGELSQDALDSLTELQGSSTLEYFEESKANLYDLQTFAERHLEGEVVVAHSVENSETLKAPEEAVEIEQDIETVIESLGESESQTHQRTDETKFSLTEDVESSTKLRSEHEKAEPFETESQSSIITLEATELLEFTGGELSQDALDSLAELQGSSTLEYFEESKANLYDLQTFAERHLEGEVVVARSVEHSETLKAPEEAVEIEQDVKTLIESLDESECQTNQQTDKTKFSLTEDVESSTKLRSEHGKAEPFETENQSSIITLEATELLKFTGGELSQDALDSLAELQGSSTLEHFEESKANLYDLQTFAERHLEGEVVVACSVEHSETLKAPEEAVEIEQDIETVIESLDESECQTNQQTDETKFLLTEDVESSTKLRSEHEKAESFEAESQPSVITLEATELLGGELSQDALLSLAELQGSSTLEHFEESKANLYDLQTFAERRLEGEIVVAHFAEHLETPEEAVEIEQDIETQIQSWVESESRTHQKTDETKFSLTEDVESSTKLRSEHERGEPLEREVQSSIITELLEFTTGERKSSQDAVETFTESLGNSTGIVEVEHVADTNLSPAEFSGESDQCIKEQEILKTALEYVEGLTNQVLKDMIETKILKETQYSLGFEPGDAEYQGTADRVSADEEERMLLDATSVSKVAEQEKQANMTELGDFTYGEDQEAPADALVLVEERILVGEMLDNKEEMEVESASSEDVKQNEQHTSSLKCETAEAGGLHEQQTHHCATLSAGTDYLGSNPSDTDKEWHAHVEIEERVFSSIDRKDSQTAQELETNWQIEQKGASDPNVEDKTCEMTKEDLNNMEATQRTGELRPTDGHFTDEKEKNTQEKDQEAELQAPADALVLEEERMLLGETFDSKVEIEVETAGSEGVKQNEQTISETTEADGRHELKLKVIPGETLLRSHEDLKEVSKPGMKRGFDQVNKHLPMVKTKGAFDLNLQVFEDSSLDFTIQKSRIAVKNPLVRPPKDPKKLISKASVEPLLPQPSSYSPRVNVSAPNKGMIGFKLPGLGPGLPVLRKTEFGKKAREGGEAEKTLEPQQKSVAEPEDSVKKEQTSTKPKWTPPKHPGMGSPFMMAELKNKLKKPVNE